jgi:hypothetical protein
MDALPYYTVADSTLLERLAENTRSMEKAAKTFFVYFPSLLDAKTKAALRDHRSQYYTWIPRMCEAWNTCVALTQELDELVGKDVITEDDDILSIAHARMQLEAVEGPLKGHLTFAEHVAEFGPMGTATRPDGKRTSTSDISALTRSLERTITRLEKLRPSA